ncbi:cardiolipin synthetase [Pontibacillus halophilus JSM 076056 = DSM 19796]|uniref:Cardiolipin synthase n=1 Tax=Pontibacillus halophilus JSM 076056 = DSM 19796 TaxID=1385510 RepID=A0A0A5GL31_9BACI|nr:cardiolipin synthase [Pontibacillus halophilus]KGX92699.1 cardiolipin synthetase [Pontibacillus halophilus JSM 076056 = DSM 19796]
MFKRIQILVFILILFGLLYVTNDFWEGRLLTSLSVMFTLSAVFIGFVIFFENRQPTQTLTWLLVLAVFPIVGFFFYMLFGVNYRKRKMFRRKAAMDEQAFQKIERAGSMTTIETEQMGDHQRLLFQLAQRIGNSPISFNTKTEILTNGVVKFKRLMEELEKAEHHIHMEYYIVRHDEIGKEIKDILIRKAQEGVEVRFLYDAVGSWKLSQAYKDELERAGVRVVPFSPVRLPFLNNKINFRNHRKIVVVDGNVGFVGGLNIGDEYIGRNAYFGDWRDTHMYVEGEAVRSLQLIFLQDWFYMTGDTLLTSNYLSPNLIEHEGRGGVQMIASGPDNQWEVIKSVFFSMIVSAKESIYIASPYFIPDEDILSALKVAALSGVDVKLLVPNRPDKRIVFHASRSYFPELLEAGVNIYEYEKGFLHSKVIIVDQELASIGTSNMDMRSFHLNFEVNAFLYRTKSTETLVQNFLTDIDNSNQLKLQDFNKRSILMRVMESTARLLSPLL